LIRALGDSDYYVRRDAADALGLIGDSRAEEPLRKALGSKDKNVRNGAKEALDKIEARKKGNK